MPVTSVFFQHGAKAWSFLIPEAPILFTSSLLPNIPPDIRAEILPNKNLSVIDFLKFPLPVPTHSPITGPMNISEFSHLSPTQQLQVLIKQNLYQLHLQQCSMNLFGPQILTIRTASRWIMSSRN